MGVRWIDGVLLVMAMSVLGGCESDPGQPASTSVLIGNDANPAGAALTAAETEGAATADFSDAYYRCAEDLARVETMNCLEAEYDRADAELNRTYRRVMQTLTPDEKEELRIKQRAWLNSMENQCDEQSTQGFGPVALNQLECSTIERIRRTHWLSVEAANRTDLEEAEADACGSPDNIKRWLKSHGYRYVKTEGFGLHYVDEYRYAGSGPAPDEQTLMVYVDRVPIACIMSEKDIADLRAEIEKAQ